MTDKKSFKERYADAVAKATTLKWTPDGLMSIGGRGIEYITLTQMKANLAPIFPEFGLIFKASQYPEALGSPVAPSGYRVRLDISIEDVYSDESMDFQYYGIGTGDKGLIVATSYALKAFLGTVFLIADGAEPPEGETETPTVFVPKTPSEAQNAVSKIKAAAKAETVKANSTPANVAPKPAKAEIPTPAPTPAPTSAPTPNPTPTATDVADISEQRRTALVNTLNALREKLEAGEIDKAQWDAIEAEAKDIKDNQSVNRFIIKYRRLVK